MEVSKWILGTQYGTGLAKNLRDIVFKRRHQDGHQLSDRIWNLAAISEREILGRVNAAISQGISAMDLSRSVRDFLLKPGPAWTTGIKPSVTGRGSLAYNALRLARTEINQGYRQAHKLQAMNSPLVVGIKWNLSASHPTNWPASAEYMGYPEICDYYAKDDHHGLGPGVFPKGNVPDDHPNGMCYNTDVLAPPEHLERLLVAHNELEAGLISPEMVKAMQEEAAIAHAKSRADGVSRVVHGISVPNIQKQDLSEFGRIYNEWDGTNVKKFATDIVNKEVLPMKVQRHQLGKAAGQCRFNPKNPHLEILTYELNSEDLGGTNYQVKTAFHELYHAKSHGLLHDLNDIGIENWAYVDDVFAEVTAHYLAQSVGISDEIAPAYASHLINTLPKLKNSIPDFASCKTIVDFGEVAYKYRFSSDATAQWKTVVDTLNRSTFDILEYSKSYLQYIDDHKAELVDKLLENAPNFAQYRSHMINDAESAVKSIRDGRSLSSNEQLVFDNALIITMNRLGVK